MQIIIDILTGNCGGLGILFLMAAVINQSASCAILAIVFFSLALFLRHYVRGVMAALLCSLCVLYGFNADAQVVGFGGGVPVGGAAGTVTSVPVDTNIAYCNIRRLQFQLTGMTNASTMFTGNVYLSTSPSNINNALLLGQYLNIGSNNTSTNFNAYPTNPPIYILLQGGSGTNTTYVQALYGP